MFRPLLRSRDFVRPEFGQEYIKLTSSESPFEWRRGSLIAALESHQDPREGTAVRKVSRGKQLMLNDAEIGLPRFG